MISSIDRITVAAIDLLSAKKTFDCFFNTSPSYEVIEENLGYKSLIYNFENIQYSRRKLAILRGRKSTGSPGTSISPYAPPEPHKCKHLSGGGHRRTTIKLNTYLPPPSDEQQGPPTYPKFNQTSTTIPPKIYQKSMQSLSKIHNNSPNIPPNFDQPATNI